VYQILVIDDNGEEIVKCERRYNNFFKFNGKIRRKYPYCLVPKLTEKHPLSEIIYPNEEFYLNREIQLRFYLSYISKHEELSQTKEFYKFLHDAEFDDGYFSHDELPYTFSNSSKITESVKNKFMGFISGMFGKKDELRVVSEEESNISKKEVYYKEILKNYTEAKQNVCTFLRCLRTSSEDYRNLSNTCLYLKDNFNETIPDAKEQFKQFAGLSHNLSMLNKDYYTLQACQIENRLEVTFLLL
jgi:hypothetical protein